MDIAHKIDGGNNHSFTYKDFHKWVSIGVKKAWLAPKDVIQDMVSEVWVRLAERGLKKDDNVSGLIISMAKNRTLSLLRDRNKRSTPNSQHNLVHTMYVHPNQELDDPMDDFEIDSPNIDLLLELIQTKHGDVLKKYYLEDMTMLEIAIEEGVTKQAISKRINRALAELKERL